MLLVSGTVEMDQNFALGPADLRGVLNVIKVRANLDISERRLPQGGRMRRRTADGNRGQWLRGPVQETAFTALTLRV